MRRILFLFLFTAAATYSSAQQSTPAQEMPAVTTTQPYLSQQQVQAAIDRGLAGKPHRRGILVGDTDSSIQSGMSCERCGGTTYTVRAFTPAMWIESGANIAKAQNRPFSIENVTPAMRSPAFRVYTYEIRNAKGKSELPDPIQHVQLTNSKHSMLLEPVKTKEADAKGASSNEVESKSGSTETAIFEMTDVDKLSNAGTDDIYVVITTKSGHSKYVEIKAAQLRE